MNVALTKSVSLHLKSCFQNTWYQLSEPIKRGLFDLEDYLFERRHRLDLSGIIKNSDLVSDDKEAIAHATAYHAVWCRNLRELFMEAARRDFTFKTFVDIGSGKGKACFYAAQNKFLLFHEIIGIEFSLPLINISNINKRKFILNNISFIHSDATKYILPDHQCLVFMFNPFDDIVLEDFLRHNKDHFREHQSVIAYANDIHRKSMEDLGFSTLFRNEVRKISLYQMTL